MFEDFAGPIPGSISRLCLVLIRNQFLCVAGVVRNENFAQPKCESTKWWRVCLCPSLRCRFFVRAPVKFLAFPFKSQSFVECRRGGGRRRAVAHKKRDKQPPRGR